MSVAIDEASGTHTTVPDELGVVDLHCIEVIAAPPNKWMQLTIKSVTPFARAKVAPLLLAADPKC